MTATPEDSLPSWAIEDVSQESMAIWCEMLRDDNPIHLDPRAAETLGFGARTVNPGPANLAYVMNMLMAALPEMEIAEIEARFLGNVLAGDSLLAEGVFDGGPLRCETRLVSMPDRELLLAAVVQLSNKRR